MKNTLLTVFVLLTLFFGYHFFADQPQSIVQQDTKYVVLKERYGTQLRSLHDGIFAPLDTQAPNPTAKIQEMRGSALADDPGNYYGKVQQKIVSDLCNILWESNKQRERREIQLRDSRSKVRTSMLRDPTERRLDEERQRLFFEAAIMRNWEDYVAVTRPYCESLLARLRELEASTAPTTNDITEIEGAGTAEP